MNFSLPSALSIDKFTYLQAQDLVKEAIWKNLSDITVGEAISSWLKTLTKLTAKNYAAGMNVLRLNGLIDPEINLHRFALLNHNAIIDDIKRLPKQSESSKQARAACFISFTRFLSRRTQGLIAKAMPSREGATQTFFKVREKVDTEAMTPVQWAKFLDELAKINKRDCLIAKVILQGAKRVNEVLSITVDSINFQKCEITFTQSKTTGYYKQTIITYPQCIIDELRAYLAGRTGLVFVTKNGNRILPYQLNITFLKAGIRAGIPFRVHPHVLRASAITYFKHRGYADNEIQKISGHTSSAQVFAYDKCDCAINPSKRENLI